MSSSFCVASLSPLLVIESSLFASFFRASFSWILRFDFRSVVFLVSKFSMSLLIASVKFFTVWWFLLGSFVLFLVSHFFCRLIGWHYTKCALSFIFLLNSLKTLITSLLLYLSNMGLSVFNSLYWRFVNEMFHRLITFPKVLIWYRAWICPFNCFT